MKYSKTPSQQTMDELERADIGRPQPTHRVILPNLISVFIVLVIVLLRLVIVESASPLQVIEYPNWRASISAPDCSGPVDSSGHLWYEVEFDDSNWNVVTSPMINDITPGEDRYYRTTFTTNFSGTMILSIASDDGIWIYINGEYVGHWGGECQEPGCVGDVPWECEVGVNWVDIDVTPFLIPGQQNVITAHVSNHILHGSDWSYFAVALFPSSVVLDLPIEYEGRDTSDRTGFYREFQYQMTALFDHSISGDETLLPFTGIELPDESDEICQFGVNCYDGHEGWDFDDLGDNNRVYPAASGEIVEDKTGCFSNDGYGCRVCISHGGSGYSTLYGHLQSTGYLTTGTVTRTTQIGIIGQTGTAGTHLHFSTFFDPDTACELGTEVDPSGWLGFEVDPWRQQTGLTSIPLWMHPLSVNAQFDPGAEAQLSWQDLDTRVTIPTEAYSETLLIRLAVAPNPVGTGNLVSNGQIFYLMAYDSEGNSVSDFNSPVQIQMVYNEHQSENTDPDAAKIYQFDQIAQQWIELPTTISTTLRARDEESVRTFIAETHKIAPFALMGERIYEVFLPIIVKVE